MNVELVAKVAHVYAHQRRSPGDRYEASEKDAQILILMNRAVRASIETLDEVEEKPKKGRYRRRDLRPEE